MNKVNFGLSLIDLHLFQKTRERYYLQYLLYSEIISVCVCKLQKRLSYVFPMYVLCICSTKAFNRFWSLRF